MPYARPGISDLINQALQDLAGSDLAGIDPYLRRAVLPQLAKTQAGFAHEHYGYLDWISLQSVPYTATGEYLEGWGALVGVYRKDATAASGTATFTGTPNTLLPSGAALVLSNGTAYTTTADGTVSSGGSVTVPFTASVAGSAGTVAAGSGISLSSPITGINGAGTVSSSVTAGADQEADSDFRTRVLLRYSSPPQGGALADYKEWALAVSGVTRAWVNPNGFGAGTVVVYPMLDSSESAFNGFPQGTNGVAASETRAAVATGDQLTVANALYSLQPVTALVYVYAPVASPVDFTIANLATSNATTQAAIEAALADVFLRLGDPIGGTVYPSDFETAIAAVPGVTRFTLQSPSAPVTVGLGNLPTVGNVSFV